MSGNRHFDMDRRSFVKSGIAAVAAVSAGIQLVLTPGARAAGKVVIQYDWLMSNGQIGDIAAVANGYFKDAGLEVPSSASSRKRRSSMQRAPAACR